MRITFLSPYVPFPVRHGGHSRSFGLLRCLAGFAKVDVLAAGDPGSPEVGLARARLGELGASLEVFQPTGPGPGESDPEDTRRLPDAASHFRSEALRAALATGPAHDVLHVEELAMAQYLDASSAPAVIDRQKIEWLHHAALAARGGAEAARHAREAERFRGWESSLRGRFARVLAVGPADRDLLAAEHGEGRVSEVPIGVDDLIWRPESRTAEVAHVLLYGSLDYEPNVEANALYFAFVWPRLRQARPGLETLVVGSGQAPAGSIPRESPGVRLVGFVPDVAPVLTGPGVLLVPLRVGGGARTKVLEALAAGMPVVSTAVGVENLGLEPGRHFLPAETAAEMAEAVLRLARDSALAERLSRAGARFVNESGHRWEAIGRRLEPLYRGAARERPSARSRPASRVLLVGVHPWPSEPAARELSFPGHRTEQFHDALVRAGCQVESVLRDEEGAPSAPSPATEARATLLAPEAFLAGRALQEAHDRVAPDLVVAAGGYHAARAVAQLRTPAPRFIDLPGDLAAEGQLRAESSPESLVESVSVLARALAAGDRFFVVGPSQRLALLGQLGLAGRLSPALVGRESVAVVPLACPGPVAAPPLPDGPPRLLSSGGYNAWLDEGTLFEGLRRAFSRRADLWFVSTGGPVRGQEPDRHASLWGKLRSQDFASRCHDLGRVSRRDALAALASSHVVVCVSRPCLEAELGSRLRLVESLAWGRPVIATRVGDLAREIEAEGAGLLIPPGDPEALGAAVLRLAGDAALLGSCAARARSLWERRHTYQATSGPLVAWAGAPSHWPASAVADAVAREAALLKAQAELAQVRASRTFRALRLFDRLLGRGR